MLGQPKESLVKNGNCVRSIKKSVGAVQSIALNPLTLVQRKLINVCLYHAYDNLKSHTEHRVHIDMLHLYFGYKGNNWGLFNESFEALQSTLFTWNIFGECTAKENLSWERVSFLSKVRWDTSSREFIYKFGEGLPEQFHFPDRYVLLTLEMQAGFTSPYSLILYEQCARYASNKNGTRWFTIEELKAILAAGDKYKKFKDFNSKILKPSIEEINLITDIAIAPSFRKEKRTIRMIKFDVAFNYKDDQLSLANDATREAAEEVRNILINDFDVASKVADSLLKDFDLKHIKQQINYVKSTSLYRKQGKGNLAGYIVKAIKENYQTTKVKKKKNQKNENEQYETKAIIEVGKKIKFEYSYFKNSLVDEKINTLNIKTNQTLLDEFKKANQVFITTIRAPRGDILSNASVYHMFRAYIIENVAEVTHDNMNFEQYLETLPEDKKIAWRKYEDINKSQSGETA